MIEKTLVFIKPQNEDIAYDVLDYLNELLIRDRVNFKEFDYVHEIRKVPEAIIAKHYEHIREFDETIFKNTIEAYKNGTIFLTGYTGENIIHQVRKNIGDLDPLKSEPGTIRGKFSKDSRDAAYREKRYLNNVIHASANKEDADRELSLWLPYLADLSS